jgi:hypothetical protein
MPLNAFDAGIHDIGLGEGDPENGFMIVGSYAKQVQQETLSLGSQEFGGQFDLIKPQPKKSRWTQDDFSGGAFQWRFDEDPTMFADCQNFLPAQQGRSVLSVPPFVQSLVFNPEDQADDWGAAVTRWPSNTIAVGQYLYSTFGHGILKYHMPSGSTAWLTPDYEDGPEYLYTLYDSATYKFYTLCNNKANPEDPGFFLRWEASGADGDIFMFPPENVEDEVGIPAFGFSIMNGYLVLQIGMRLWTFSPPQGPLSSSTGSSKTGTYQTFTEQDDGLGVDANGKYTNWVDKGRLPGRWIDAVDYNTLTNILVRKADHSTHLMGFDGTDVFPITSMPYNFMGKCIFAYAGRMFVGGAGTDSDGGDRYAELHEISGSSERLVRTFSPETYRGGSTNQTYPVQIRSLMASEGFLWLMEDWGGKAWIYDVTTDGFFGGPQNIDTAVRPIDVVHGLERVYFWGDAAPGDEEKRGFYRVKGEGDDLDSQFYPIVETSDFMVEPAMNKRWDSMVVLSRYASLPNGVGYSIDGGANFGAGLPTTVLQQGNLYYTTIDLTSIGPTKSIRFQIAFEVEPEDAGQFIELMAYTVSFTFEETETKKHAWSFTVNGSDRIEGRDNSDVEQETDTIRDQLWAWMDNKTELRFRDFSGDTKAVKIDDLIEQMPLIGPDAPDEVEAYYSITLLEV